MRWIAAARKVDYWCGVDASGLKSGPSCCKCGSPALGTEPGPPGWARRCLPGPASALQPPGPLQLQPAAECKLAGRGGGLHNARRCPSLASRRRSRRPRPGRLIGRWPPLRSGLCHTHGRTWTWVLARGSRAQGARRREGGKLSPSGGGGTWGLSRCSSTDQPHRIGCLGAGEWEDRERCADPGVGPDWTRWRPPKRRGDGQTQLVDPSWVARPSLVI